MTPRRLRILCLSQIPPSPPGFGAQARIHGLMTQVARRHDLTVVSLLDEEFDAAACERAMREYCRDVVLVENPAGRGGSAKRALQLRSLASWHSFERLRNSVPGLQDALDRTLRRDPFDVVVVEFHYLAHYRLRLAPPGSRPPVLVLDTHEIAHDLARQMSRSAGLGRRISGSLNWRKLRREELAAFRGVDGLCTCSLADEERLRLEVPSARTAVIPNAADVESLQPRPSDPPPDGRTVVFFGHLSTFPNVDGLSFFLREIWPRISAARPEARFQIIGPRAPPALRALAQPGVEVVGFVDDLRSRLTSAAAVVVPLRVGSGTRLKIVEGMAMGKAIVSTSLGAEGIEAVPDRDLLVADDPASFAASVVRLLESPALVERIGRAGRQLAVERYSWGAAALALEAFALRLLAERDASR